MNKAIFLDRDGTVNVDVDYLHECDKVQIIPGVIQALKTLKEKGYLLIVISNQSGVGRGYFPVEDVDRVNQYINLLLQQHQIKIDDFYFCPHTESDHCECRKPAVGLYLQAAKDYCIDLHESYMVGDKITDVLAAAELGCGFGIVFSGHDIEEEHKNTYREYCYRDLLEFAQAI